VGAVAAAALGAIIEPTLLRPLYKRAEEYQLLVTFGLLLILEDLLRFIWGPYPLSASSLFEALGSLSIAETVYPAYNLVVIVVGAVAAAVLWALIYKTKFGVILRATSQNMRMASALGVNVNRVYMQAFTLGCFMAGLGGAIIVPQQGAVLGMGVDALILAFVVVVIGGLGRLEGARLAAPLVGPARESGLAVFPGGASAVLHFMAPAGLLIRHGRLRRGLYRQVLEHHLHGSLSAWRHPRLGGDRGAVRLPLRPLHADLLRHPDVGSVPSALEPRLQVLLGHRRNRRAESADAVAIGHPKS